jgi:Response regulator containing a CheY-like receiver domain and an HTH DNA-binding domain
MLFGKSEWIEVLNLAFSEGLEDKVIAPRMQVAPRTVRHYWTKVQDVLGVYLEDGKSLRFRNEFGINCPSLTKSTSVVYN